VVQVRPGFRVLGRVLAGLVHDHGVVAAGGGHILLLSREAGQGRVGEHVIAGRELYRFGEHDAAAVIVRGLDRVAVAGVAFVKRMLRKGDKDWRICPSLTMSNR